MLIASTGTMLISLPASAPAHFNTLPDVFAATVSVCSRLFWKDTGKGRKLFFRAEFLDFDHKQHTKKTAWLRHLV